MTMLVTDRDNGSEIRAAAGDVLELRLSENATAGYRWQPEHIDPRVFEVTSASGDYPSQVPGSGGTAIFQVKVLTSFGGKLGFMYLRPWEGEAGVLNRFSIIVTSR